MLSSSPSAPRADPSPILAKCVRDPANPARCKKCEKKKLVCEWPEGEMSRRACDEW